MSELILSWLNDDLQLSRKICSFEKDLSNGYLFGEILARYNQQLNFSEFVNKNDKDSKLKNFTLLFDTFKSLRVGFDSNVVTDVIQQKEGVSKKILYELKMQLERSTSSLNANSSTIGLTYLKKVEIGKEKKDKLDGELFKRRLQEKHKAQKKINQELVLKKFSDFHQAEREKLNQVKQRELTQAKLAQQQLRNKLRTTFKRTQEFRQQWQKSNIEKWGKNMDMRKIQSNKDTQYLHKVDSLKSHLNSAKEAAMLNQVTRDIDDFENRFGQEDRQSDDQVQSRGVPAVQSALQFLPKDSKISVAQSLRPTSSMRVNKTPQSQESSRKERDKRRRMMIVNQNKHQSLIQLERREQELMFNLHQTSKQEKEIQYQIWRAWQNKSIIVENRKLRQTHYSEKEEASRLNSQFKNEELLRELRQEHQADLQSRLKRQGHLASEHRVSQRKELHSSMAGTVLHILDIAEECYQHCQDNNNKEIEPHFFDELCRQFVDGSKNTQCVVQQELNDYVEGQGVWKFEVERLNSEPTQPQKQNSIPVSAVNNIYLGNVLRDIYTRYTPKEDNKEAEVSCEAAICLLGLESAGKHQVADRICREFSLHPIDPEQILRNVLTQLISQSTHTETQSQLLQVCLKGQKIPEEILFSIIKQQMASHSRFCLINYPLTYNQCLFLTSCLSGIVPSDQQPALALQQQLSRLSLFARPTPDVVVPWKIKSCGLDLVLYLDIDVKTSLNRFMGQRRIQGEKMHIESEELGNFDVRELEMGDRGVNVVQRNNYILNNLPDVRDWLLRFGTGQATCWRNVGADGDIESVAQMCVQEVSTMVQAKALTAQEALDRGLDALKHHEQIQTKLKQKEVVRSKCCLTSKESLQQQLSLAVSSIQLNPEFVNVWAVLLKTACQRFVSMYHRALENLYQQRLDMQSKLASYKRRFLNLLARQDSKFQIVKSFQLSYNKFVSQNRDMVEEDQTKEELHQRVDDLEDKMIDISASRVSDAEEEKNSFINSGWLEQELQYLYSNIELLAQTEIERTFVSQQVISDYFATVYGLEANPMTQLSTELQVDSTLELIAGQEFPRLDKLFLEVFRVFGGEELEVVDDKNKKGGKAPVPKKDDKKQPKKNAEVEEKKQQSSEQVQLQSAINTEKSIFRYRINILKQYARRELRSLKSRVTSFYSDLQSLIGYTEKVETEAISQTSKIVRGYIEKEGMIQREIQMSVFNVYIHSRILNFEDPKPVTKPAKEQVFPNKFTISQLAYMINNLLQEGENYTKRIANHKLLTVLVRTTGHKQTMLRLPETWRTHSFKDYDAMIKNLDCGKTGFVQLENLFMLFMFTNMQIPSQEVLDAWRTSLLRSGSHLIGKDEFVSTEAWFDSLERQPAQINTHYFDRPRHLKQLLFQQMRLRDQPMLNVDHLVSSLGLEHYSKARKEGQTYYDYMFDR